MAYKHVITVRFVAIPVEVSNLAGVTQSIPRVTKRVRLCVCPEPRRATVTFDL